jgi:N-acetylglutamate synthase-like GNAT family acetyltransferase
MVQIVTYQPTYAAAFKDLNYAWIEQLFEIEASDIYILENPQESIINQGGEVLIALLDGVPVGACALIKKNESLYELAKMAVAEEARGNKIGLKLGLGIIAKAKEFGASKLYLETNSELIPAINLYRKLGFVDSQKGDSPYERCNVQMEIEL